MKLYASICFIVLSMLISKPCFAQRPIITQVPSPSPNTKRVDFKSDSATVFNLADGTRIRKFMRNVRFKQENMVVTCAEATQNELTGLIEAYGNVKILKGDSITVLSDTALYYSQIKLAKLNGRVSMNDKVMTLTTKKLDYDMANALAFYTEKGNIIDKENTLTSKEGFYNTRTKVFIYKTDVKLVGKSENKKPFVLKSDSLRYNTKTKIANFIAPTFITSEKDNMLAKSGLYDSKARAVFLTSRSKATNDEYDMEADTIYYDRTSQIGVLIGNAEMISKKDSAVITGNHVDYAGQMGRSKVYGKAILRNIVKKDTLYIAADTLLSLDNKETKTRKMLAFKHVLIYKQDFQGKCDSLIYNTEDSTISFYQKPILWSDGNQSEADSIWVQMANSKIQVMYLKGKSFIVSIDSLSQFNQIKGRKITANFDKTSKLDRVKVEGNGESVYFAIDEKNKAVGMNRVQCSKMNLNFVNSKVQRVSFIGKPESQFIPPKLVNDENKNLAGFNWRIVEKPTKGQVLGKETIPPSSVSDKKRGAKTIGQTPKSMTAKPTY